MTAKEQQQKEIERLQKKLQNLSAAYADTVQELEQLKKETTKKKHRGRPGVTARTKGEVLALYRMGKSMRQTAAQTELAVGTVHKIIKEAEERSRVVFVYMDRGEPETVINAYGATERVEIINLTEDLIDRAFGIKEHPSWADYEFFLEERCMPRTRYGIREELKYMGLDVYDPFLIVEQTKGRVHGDSQWLKRLEAEEIEAYDQIIKEIADPQERVAALTRMFRQEKGEWLR